ncbi:hypothetical protein Cgig2_030424 [Carnegiea gigantea]|uniref:Uncharacterized protein n=1 Tax=Carnegiea gigantea TaxID=171969 RepID=A0A9Q1QLJ8_9CARY|nr:hypothetical protein Cgig2_030424 [Carnegiea gigantea]
MTDTILKQVTEQVKKTIEAVSSIRPLPTFDYVSTANASRPTATLPLSHYVEVMKERHSAGHPGTTGLPSGPRGLANSANASTPYAIHSRHMACRNYTIYESIMSFMSKTITPPLSAGNLRRPSISSFDKGQIDCFLKRGSGSLCKDRNLAHKEP